jgi:hypothetical protein
VLRAAFADANVAAATVRELVECMHTSAMAWPRFSDKATLFFGLAFDMMLSEYVTVCVVKSSRWGSLAGRIKPCQRRAEMRRRAFL